MKVTLYLYGLVSVSESLSVKYSALYTLYLVLKVLKKLVLNVFN